MITRIVRMVFQEGKTSEFLQIFNISKAQIRDFEGCEYLSLHKDLQLENVFYTISYWASEHHLEDYRSSELFRSTWAKTKTLFSEKPMAFSLDKQDEME